MDGAPSPLTAWLWASRVSALGPFPHLSYGRGDNLHPADPTGLLGESSETWPVDESGWGAGGP